MSRYSSMARCHNCGHEEGEHMRNVPHHDELTPCGHWASDPCDGTQCECRGFVPYPAQTYSKGPDDPDIPF